ncbi:hypothetical protein OF829_08870 [Sphingomonas sp. LB-2]|uniref:hypothetical protein n=1 Tax=Sphingomonas caeni TaxID=2984949 RepID=UPI00222EFDE9|nr:hypothetical protein [Sphingomonas caeni]MCW3847352.1 hypothetical protein [Sphingomonas caeni]
MQTEPLRALARTIYDACFPTDEVAPVGFDEAERFETIHYRRAVTAAKGAQLHLQEQPTLF